MSGQPPIETLAHEPEPDSDGPSIVTRFGFIVAGGVVSAFASSLPAALRMANDASAPRAIEQWVVLAAVSMPLAVTAVAVLRRARVGLLLLVGERALLLAVAVLWWSVIELGLLSVFGALLRKTTHHHALAGVTFSAFAIVTGIIVALFARRGTMILVRGGTSVPKIGLVMAAACAFVVTMLVGLRASRAEGLHAAAALVDVLAFAMTTTIASSRLFNRWRPMAIAGVPVAVLLIIAGLTTLRFDPKLQESLGAVAPIHAFVIGLFGS